MKRVKTLTWLAAAMLMPATGFAQEAPAAVPTDVVWIMNTLLFLIGGFLVFFMASGFAMLEAGLVRSKNVTMQLTKTWGSLALPALLITLSGTI